MMNRKKIAGAVLLLAFALAATGCERLPGQEQHGTPVAKDSLTQPDQIPAAWGRLVSVSQVSAFPDLAQLWFEDDQGVVRMVVFRVTTHELVHARAIRRG